MAAKEFGICFVPGVLCSADHGGGAIAPDEDGRFFLPQRVEQIAFEGQVMERVVAGEAPQRRREHDGAITSAGLGLSLDLELVLRA